MKCRFSTGFSHARICSLRVEPFSVIAWVISVRAGADVPPGRARAATPPAGPAALAGPGSSPVKSTTTCSPP
eukprot:2564971-Prymnesium_polylepis.1